MTNSEKKRKKSGKAIFQKKQQETKKQHNEQERRQLQVQKVDPETENRSEELYEYIKEFGFTIDSYEQHEPEYDENGYPLDETLETYYCSYGEWQFKVRNYADVDIEEGIFSLSDIVHKKTGETVEFYCDLGCRTSSEMRCPTSPCTNGTRETTGRRPMK